MKEEITPWRAISGRMNPRQICNKLGMDEKCRQSHWSHQSVYLCFYTFDLPWSPENFKNPNNVLRYTGGGDDFIKQTVTKF